MRSIFLGKVIPTALLSAVVSLAQSTERISAEAASVAVPEPGTNMLIGGALLGLAVAFRKRAKS
ncbi:MAG: PEP-CTERM sorting domain-containing protein [Acidobacteria bacterium]|nr:PEP-CTERM sorting domain-containing protein [Acidobacteriota bacterium]